LTLQTKKQIKSMFILFAILVSFSLCTFQAAALQDQDVNNQDNILATVNGEKITLQEFEEYWNMIPENYKLQLTKEDLLEQIITQTLLIQKAEEINLREDPEVAFKINNTVNQILIQSLLEKEIIEKTILSDEDIESYYEENKEDYWQEEEVHALNILVETEEIANEVMKKLEEGQEFTELAKEFSSSSTASSGGDIGFISKGTLTSKIEEQLFVLETGEISEIIPTERGFHIFKIVDKNPSRYLELSDVKEEIRGQLTPIKQQEAFNQYLQEIEDSSTIERNIELLKDESTEKEENNAESNDIK